MRTLHCHHCDVVVQPDDTICKGCGMPLPKDLGVDSIKTFRIWMIILVTFCLFMMFWLPPNWSWFLGD